MSAPPKAARQQGETRDHAGKVEEENTRRNPLYPVRYLFVSSRLSELYSFFFPPSPAFLRVQALVLVAPESVLGSCHFHTGKVSINAHQHIGWAGLTLARAAMAAAKKAGSFRLGKYKSNGISVELIRTRMEDLALECQRKLRREHVSERLRWIQTRELRVCVFGNHRYHTGCQETKYRRASGRVGTG